MLNAQLHLNNLFHEFFVTLGNARAHFMSKQVYLSVIVGNIS